MDSRLRIQVTDSHTVPFKPDIKLATVGVTDWTE